MAQNLASFRPRVFIGSSSEGLSVATAIREHLGAFAEPRLWNEPGMFRLGVTTLDNLKAQSRQYAAAVLVFTPDDMAEIRGSRYLIARDNVVFEMGLFMGVLPVHRVLFVIPKAASPFRVPTDLAGYTYGVYDASEAVANAADATAPLSALIRDALTRPRPGELPVRTMRGTMHVRNLQAIGPAVAPVVDPIFSYDVASAELVIDDSRVSIRGRVKMEGPVVLDGVFEGHGEFLQGTAYIVYTIRDDGTGHIFKGVGLLQVPALGPVAKGYWISEASVEPGTQGLAAGDVRFDCTRTP